MKTVKSLQEVSALHNISPRTVAENQTEQRAAADRKTEAGASL